MGYPGEMRTISAQCPTGWLWLGACHVGCLDEQPRHLMSEGAGGA